MEESQIGIGCQELVEGLMGAVGVARRIGLRGGDLVDLARNVRSEGFM